MFKDCKRTAFTEKIQSSELKIFFFEKKKKSTIESKVEQKQSFDGVEIIFWKHSDFFFFFPKKKIYKEFEEAD